MGQSLAEDALKQEKLANLNMDSPPPEPEDSDSSSGGSDYMGQTIKCSAVHTLERNMPDFDYSHLIEELRTKILDDCDANPGTFSQRDYVKCKTDNWYLSRFLLRQGLDVEAAFEMLRKAMRYNHESLVASMRPEDFPAEFYNIGGLFSYEPDRKGNRMLYLRVRVHRKIPEIQAVLQTFLYSTIQRIDEEANGRGEC